MEENKLTAKELKKKQLMDEMYVTVYGRMNISQMIKKFGNPKVVIKSAIMEVRTTFTSTPFIKVERFVDAELHFEEDLVVKGLKKEFALDIDSTGIENVKVRPINYKPANPPKATQSEIKHWEKTHAKAIH